MIAGTSAVRWRERRIGPRGAQIAVFETGAYHAQARTLVLVHGLGHWAEAAWGRLVPHLDPNLRIVALDLPGFGASDRPDVRYDAAFFVNALDAVVAESAPARFALAGHSLGGAIAARYAGVHPERVSHLALIAPAGFLRTPRVLYAMIGSALLHQIFMRRATKLFVRHTMEHAVVDSSSIDPDVMERAYELAEDVALRRAFVGVYSAAMGEFVHADQLRASVRDYTGPALIAWGRKDAYVPIRALDEVKAVYPHATVEILEHSAHLPMVEEPETLARALGALLG